jgi:voltage-gated potassium channel Kch
MDPLRLLGIALPRPRARWRWFRWRFALLALPVVLSMVGFSTGVAVSERPGVVEAGVLVQLYYSLGLFLFGGMDLGTPVGGPWAGRLALWIAYFVAPIITASAVIEAVLRMIGADSLYLRRLEGHIVVAGCGRLTILYLRRLRELQPRLSVVVVGDPSENTLFDFVRDEFRVQVIEGDITSDALLGRLRLRQAARVLLLTDDDFTNLDAASGVLHHAPELGDHVVVHVSDLRFMRSMTTTRLAKECHVFNGHQIAAAHLVHEHLLDHFHRTKPTDQVVLAGFGRFGQTVLEELQRGAAGAFDRVVIVDLEAGRRAAIFEEQVGFSPQYARTVVDGDIRDPLVWMQVHAALDPERGDVVFVVGSGEDRANLRVALSLRSRYPDALVIGRSERPWVFAEAFSAEAGIATLSVAQLVAESMPLGWFGPKTDRVARISPPGVWSTSGAQRQDLAPAGEHLAPDAAPPG